MSLSRLEHGQPENSTLKVDLHLYYRKAPPIVEFHSNLRDGRVENDLGYGC